MHLIPCEQRKHLKRTNQPAKYVVVALLHPARWRHLSLTEVASRVDSIASASLYHGYMNVRFDTPGRFDALSHRFSGCHLHECKTYNGNPRTTQMLPMCTHTRHLTIFMQYLDAETLHAFENNVTKKTVVCVTFEHQVARNVLKRRL